MRSLMIALLALTASGIGQQSSNGCYQESALAYGKYSQGTIKSDLAVVSTLTGQHRLYNMMMCVETQTGSLKGFRATAAIFGNPVTSIIAMDPFGDISDSCTIVTFVATEYLQKFSIYYTSNKVVGIGFQTSGGFSKTIGQTKGTLKTPISAQDLTTSSQFEFIGFFGSSSDMYVYSLGPIYRRTDCLKYATVAPPDNTVATSTQTNSVTFTTINLQPTTTNIQTAQPDQSQYTPSTQSQSPLSSSSSTQNAASSSSTQTNDQTVTLQKPSTVEAITAKVSSDSSTASAQTGSKSITNSSSSTIKNQDSNITINSKPDLVIIEGYTPKTATIVDTKFDIRKRIAISVAIVVVIIAALVGGLCYLLKRKNKKQVAVIISKQEQKVNIEL